MSMKNQKEHRKQSGRRHQLLSGLVVLCLLLNFLNIHYIPAHASDQHPITFDVGGGVSAVLYDGILTLSGQGKTDDYSAENTPFLAYADEIHSLVIEDGVKYIGSYLFYGLGNLSGELTLPGSIVGFGDYAFSGSRLQSSPKFTVIKNEFVSAEVLAPDPVDSGAVSDNLPGDDMTVPDNAEDSVEAEGPEPENEALTNEADTQDTVPEDTDPVQTIPPESEPPEDNAAVENKVSEDVDQTTIITYQEVSQPEILFMEGQTGLAVCTAENSTFAESAQAAGYQVSDASVTVMLDDTVELELPLYEGQVCLPECPEDIKAVHTEDSFFSYEFAGWSQISSGDAVSAAAPGEYMAANGSEQIRLYSVWNTLNKYQIRASAVLEGAEAVYTLAGGDSKGELAAPEGYVFSYQWQIAEKVSEGEAGWSDIEGAEGTVYKRMVEAEDADKQLRCKVTAGKQTRARNAEQPVTLYSEGVDAAVEVHTVYVDQTNGSDSGSGAEDAPFQTLTKASQYLNSTDPNGTVETNKVVLLSNYSLDLTGGTAEKEGKILGGTNADVTICGVTGGIRLKGTGGSEAVNDNEEKSIDLSGNLKLERLTLANTQHIYGNGFNITIGKNVTSASTYLYGTERSPAAGSTIKAGKIRAESGNFARIVGYARSYTDPKTGGVLNVNNEEANITVCGSANVGSIISGSASGGIDNANVKINIESGTVGTIVGGNQGYLNSKSPFTGDTTIKVSGGKVTDIYGAGTGRNASIPTYLGHLHIEVTGGTVDNIYGAGSAAFIKSQEGMGSSVDISVQGGTIANIYAAGKGNENAVSLINEGSKYQFDAETPPEKFGSLQGTANIVIGDKALITGNIYASGSGDSKKTSINGYTGDGLTKNAYLDGSAVITVNGGVVKGSIYGGGKGVAKEGYSECARVEKASTVKVVISGGTVEGSVFGGGENGKVEGNTDVTINGGTVKGNVYGGSKNAVVEGKTNVTITNGTIESSVYGGALGTPGECLVLGGATVNMAGGWVKQNLYGGSEKSDDGAKSEGEIKDMIFVNMTGGTVTRNVFGGGYLGMVYGSTHVHIGIHAPDKCLYYKSHSDEKPSLTASSLQVAGSAYAGGDFGGGTDYNKITITGTSHVYIDGTDYDTGGEKLGDPDMTISGGVFGSGASCDAGSTRLVTLDHYGARNREASSTDTTRTLEAVQRADRVLMIESHVRLTGKSDIANSNATALYSLNRIGDHVDPAVGDLGKGLVLQGGSTVILDSEAIGLGRFSSIDSSGAAVALEKVGDGDGQTPNKVCFDAGTVFRVATEAEDKTLTYGEVSGYAYMEAGDKAEVFAYARVKTNSLNSTDGGFADSGRTDVKEELQYVNVDTTYRYWQMKKAGAEAERATVLTVQELKQDQDGYIDGDYSVAEGTIELPHASRPTEYTVKQVSLTDTAGIKLAEAARKGTGTNGEWVTSKDNQASGDVIELEPEKNLIKNNPLSYFGLYMEMEDGIGISAAKGKLISDRSMVSGDANTIINTQMTETQENTMPKIKFYLTYSNQGITVSRNLGTVVIQLEGKDSEGEITTINMKAEIVSKATALSSQTIDLYATQNGSYTGKLTIPAGVNRSLKLQNVSSDSAHFVNYDSEIISDQQFGINMQPVQSSGWREVNTGPYDLKSFSSGTPVTIGTTDSRYEAVVEFNLKNSPGFAAQENPDTVKLTLIDDDGQTTDITLNVNWSPSVVSKVHLASGRQYENFVQESVYPAVSSRSTVTVQFVLGSPAQINELWLELKNTQKEETATIPPGTTLTLITGNEFYIYTVTGNETDGRIKLTDFTQMWGTAALTGSTVQGAEWVVITDFSSGTSVLAPDNYSLRLRGEKSADSQDDYFTVNNSEPTVSMSAASAAGLSRDEYSFTLQASTNGDTRFTSGAAALLVPGSGTAFPAGTVIKYEDGDKMYSVYPRGGRVYLPMPESGGRTFTMSTVDTAGLLPGIINFKAVLMPGGISSGGKWGSLQSSPVKVDVAQNPETALTAALQDRETRVVKAKDQLKFKMEYIMTQSDSAVIEVKEQKKNTDGTYSDTAKWAVTGNTAAAGTASQVIEVTVPDSIAAGTYRIVFMLNGQTVLYNVIVE